MPGLDLTLIGERINPGFASTKTLLDAWDLAGLQELARQQAAQGAHSLTVNIGTAGEADPRRMGEMVRALQAAVDLPLAIDSPDPAVQEAGLAAYDPQRARGRPPIMNSLAEARWEMLALRRRFPCRILFMVSERLEGTDAVRNRDAASTHATAARLVARARAEVPALTADECLIDVSVCPVASDTENLNAAAVGAIRRIGADPTLRGCHQSVGISNLGILLPKLGSDGKPLRQRLENAFLTETAPHGLDWLLGSPGRRYARLAESDPILAAFRRILAADGFEALLEVRELYAAGAES